MIQHWLMKNQLNQLNTIEDKDWQFCIYLYLCIKAKVDRTLKMTFLCSMFVFLAFFFLSLEMNEMGNDKN
jgi:hypothetical protein